MSRASSFTQAIADEICRRIANGEGLRAICRDENMPPRQTVLDWLDDERHSTFRAKYARAREALGDYLDEEMQEVAASATIETVNLAKLRIETMRWRASKLAPKKYGDKIEHTGDVTHSFVALLPAKSASEEDWEKAHAPPLLEHVKPKGRG